MIRRLTVSVARLLFGASLLVLMFGAGIAYLAYRMIRVVLVDDKPYPVKEAAFGVMVSSAMLAKAIQAEQERKAAGR